MNRKKTKSVPERLNADAAFRQRVDRLSMTFTGMDWRLSQPTHHAAKPANSADAGRGQTKSLTSRVLDGLAYARCAIALRLSKWRARRVAVARIERMNGHMLRDIGIEPHQVDGATLMYTDLEVLRRAQPRYSRLHLPARAIPKHAETVKASCRDLAA